MMIGVRVLVAVLTIVFAVNVYNAEETFNPTTCDHSFGYAKWNYSYVFFNESIVMKAGTRELKEHLPKENGEMISFVCVNAPGLHTDAAFSPISGIVTVTAAGPVTRDEIVHILAKKHGY